MFDFMILNNHILFIIAINLISQLISLARWTAINVLANYFEFTSHKDVGLFRKPWVICIMKSSTQSYHFFLFCRFFGQEPPMMKVFLKELGYEVRQIYWQTTVNLDDFGMCGDFGHTFYAIKEFFWEKKGA